MRMAVLHYCCLVSSNFTSVCYWLYFILTVGGAALGYYHIGLAKALWNEGLLPRVISGASAGSMIAATLG